MSDAASEAEPKGKKAKSQAAVAAAAAKAEEKKEELVPPGPSEEHASDLYETRMEYDPSAKVPIIVILIWICAIIGFVAYMAVYLFPDLALWGNP
jgi:hypothetical protein